MSYSEQRLAGLKPFQPGNTAPRRSADVHRAVRKVRKATPWAVDYCIALLRDDTAETAHRLKAALAIIDKTIPDAGADALAALNPDRVGSISLHIVRHEHARADDDAPKLSVRTITIGEADD